MVSRVTEGPTEVHILAWNPHVSQGATRVARIIDEDDDWADLFAFNEVRPLFEFLGDLAKRRGLRHYQERPEDYGAIVSEKGSSALLAAPTFVTNDDRVLVLERRWKVFSKNRWHFGRRLVVVRGKKNGHPIKVVVVHGPTNGPLGGNRWAFSEFLAELLRLILTTRPGTALVIVGDWNAKREEIARWMNHPALRLLGLRLAGHNVDLCLVRGGRVSARVGKSKRGSDHYPVWFTVVLSDKLITRVRKALAGRK